MMLLFDIGNTHTHIGMAENSSVYHQVNIATADWYTDKAEIFVKKFIAKRTITEAGVCSVVPKATPNLRRLCRTMGWRCFELNADSVCSIGIDYPRPTTIGPDRLANAIAVYKRYGAPSVVIDFGTAVTFDVLNRKGAYIGGIIAPGLAAMTEYLHEKTALLPRIHIREVNKIVGKNTQEAMLIGAVHGYRGLIRELIKELRAELKTRKLPVVATGGYAALMAAKLPEIIAVEPLLTLEGLLIAATAGSRLKACS